MPQSPLFSKENVAVKRSIRIAGHRTSVSLEPAFWDELKAIANETRCSLNELVKSVDTKRKGNLSSALRLFVLKNLKEKASRAK